MSNRDCSDYFSNSKASAEAPFRVKIIYTINDLFNETKLGISVGGWGVLPKMCDSIIRIYQKHAFTIYKLCYIGSCFNQKDFLSKVVRICPNYAQLKGFTDIFTTGLLHNFSAPNVFFRYFSAF